MTIPDMRNWSDEDRLIAADFLTLDPPLAVYPHLIFRASRRSLELVFKTVNAQGGLWGDTLPFDANGNDHATNEWPVIQQFQLWGQTQNQEHLLNTGWVGSLTEFRMVIAATTNPQLLVEMASTSTYFAPEPTFDWQTDFENLAQSVDRLGWAYVPLVHGELDHALFLTRNGGEQWRETLQAHLFAAGYKCAKLRRSQERVQWDGPVVL